MADKSYEIAFWPASDAYRNDQSVGDPSVEYLRLNTKAEGIFHGLQSEEPNFNAVIAWNKIQDHKDLIDDTVKYPKLRELLKVTMAGGDIEMVHVNFTADPTPAFKAPVTEYVYITPNSPEDKSTVQGYIDRIAAWANDPSTVALGGARGSTVERPEEYVLVIGWPSIEAHTESLKSGAGEIVAKLGTLSTAKLRHTALSSYNAS
ncbi:hypothetical protein BC834DRAFT_569223 [Gloeopeniophorella convolvens]|nr:hypothetical protein BC834DRAFT_569223 [Gloeopeniophorella convolvens]